MHSFQKRAVACVLIFPLATFVSAADTDSPITSDDVVFAENDGLLAVEAEHFFSQTMSEKRAFHLTTADSQPEIDPDGDPAHVAGASGGAYLEILPDTRRTHGDKLIRGTNFAPEAGKMAVLSYKVNIKTPGRYYVWVRAFSTGSEDNGLHVGLDGEWPATGQRLQWCEGKNGWRWESKQRTEKQHCGEPHKIFLEIKEAGEHTISFSMREDGFEFDKWLMTTDREFKRPNDVGPKSIVHAGTPPKSFRFVKAMPKPAVKPVAAKNADVKLLSKALVISATDYSLANTGFYLDQGKWAAINPEQRKKASAGATFAFPTGTYNVTLMTVGENDGQSKYDVLIDTESVGSFEAPLSSKMYEEGATFHKTWQNVRITEGAVVEVSSEVGSKDGAEFSRARWSGIAFEPADAATRKLVSSMLKKQVLAATASNDGSQKKASSPTKPVSNLPLILPRQPDGNGRMGLSGELKQWHTFTLTLNGPYAHEQDNAPNPFTDYRLQVTFTHSDGTSYNVPGYFAADGEAANTSAQSGTKWRVNFVPDRVGVWQYKVDFRTGDSVALDSKIKGERVVLLDGKSGSMQVGPSNKSGRDLRAHGRLQYVGRNYLQFAGSKKYFLKAGADAPETLLGYADFDNTIAGKPQKVPLKTWAPHVKDWNDGDPTWKDGKGKGLIGAVNYLSGKGCNAFSFLTYNAGGDGDNVWPFIQRDDKLHYDCSKLDQWGIVFDHGTRKGMYLHFKMQETENDDHRRHRAEGGVPECLDNGDLGPQRRLYCRELIARFGHNLALNWNLGEENTQTTDQQQAMIDFIAETDPYGHNIVVHTFPNEQDKVYDALIGDKSQLTGVSLQNSGIKDTHHQTVKWVRQSMESGKPWIVAFDESGTAAHGQCPDLGYRGFDGKDGSGKMIYTEHEVRRQTLWGTLMGGGAGVEYYFGYQFAENDLICEDWRSRDRSWDYCRIAINFFSDHSVPIHEMRPSDELVGNESNDNSKYCLAKPGEVYVVYLPEGGTTMLDLSEATGMFTVDWFNPRTGGKLSRGEVSTIDGGSNVSIGNAPDGDDWVALIRKASK